MKPIALVGVVTLFAAAFGCVPHDPKAKMRESARRYIEAADLLVTVKDVRSFEAAKPTLKKFLAWERQQQKESKKAPSGNRMPTEQEMKTAMNAAADVMNSPEIQEMTKAAFRFMGEVVRWQVEVPGFKEFYAKEMGPT